MGICQENFNGKKEQHQQHLVKLKGLVKEKPNVPVLLIRRSRIHFLYIPIS